MQQSCKVMLGVWTGWDLGWEDVQGVFIDDNKTLDRKFASFLSCLLQSLKCHDIVFCSLACILPARCSPSYASASISASLVVSCLLLAFFEKPEFGTLFHREFIGLRTFASLAHCGLLLNLEIWISGMLIDPSHVCRTPSRILRQTYLRQGGKQRLCLNSMKVCCEAILR